MNGLALSYANPALWVWSLALAAPLVIHVLARRTPVRMVFPTVRYLKAARASQSLPYRLRHYILLLLRTALLAALLMAFLRPVLHAGAAPAAEGEGRAVVLVVDASMSMGYAGEGFTPFARAQAAARRILDEARPGDRANVIFAGATPRPIYDRLSENRIPLLRDLERAVPTAERADIDAAVAEALKQLAETAASARELHFLSDFQRSNWASVKFAAIPKDVRTVFVAVGDDAAANTAVTDVSLQPAAPAAGETVDVSCKVANYGPLPRETAVQLRFEGEAFRESLALDAGSTATVRFRIHPARPGTFEGTVSSEDDALALDNTRYFTVDVSDRVRTLVLSDEGAYDPGAAQRFLARAINPYGDDEAGPVGVQVLRADAFDTFAAAHAHVVVLAGVRALSESTAARLVAYLRDGGSVVYFLGQPVDRDNLALLEKTAAGDLVLPFQVRDLLEPEDFATLGAANFDAPVLAQFRDGNPLGDVRFFRHFQTERTKGRGQVLLRYVDDNVAMAQQSLGAGSLVLCNFSPARVCSDLAKRPVFVPLVHELIRNLRPRSGAGRAFHVGYPASATVRLAPDAPLRFEDASGATVNGTFEVKRDEAAVFFPPVAAPGFCRVYAGDNRAGSVAVNVDGRESPLDALSAAQLRELSRAPRDRFLAASGRDPDNLAGLTGGRPLWHYFALAALCLAGLEQALAWVWRT